MRRLSGLRRDDSQPASHPSQAAKIPRVLRKGVMLINNKTCIPANSQAEMFDLYFPRDDWFENAGRVVYIL